MNRDPLDEAARAALDGRLVVFPTDTVYGLATRPDDPTATARIFDAKRRGRDLELPVLVATLATARQVAVLDDRAERLAAAFWPGALTLVLPRTEFSRAWDLGSGAGDVAVRIPAHPLATAVLTVAGPLAVTSANRSGEPTATTCDQLRDTFGPLVDVLLCDEEPLGSTASTVLDLAHGRPRVLRRGDVTPEAIERFLPSGEALLDSRPSS